MMLTMRRNLSIYGSLAAMTPKFFLAYRGWVWMGLFTQAIAMTIALFFWKAVYANTADIGGLNVQQALNYILLAQVLSTSLGTGAISTIGQMLHDGTIGIELVRPVDFQMANYVRGIAQVALALVINMPLLLLALFYGIQLPSNPLVWLSFAVSLFLGASVLFMFDWLFACVAFYTTEVWGVMVLQWGIMQFFSGALLPVVMMPGWLQNISNLLPFAQTLYVPVAILAGTIPLDEVPERWFVQLLWLIGLGIASRVFFNISVRKVTVQGG